MSKISILLVAITFLFGLNQTKTDDQMKSKKVKIEIWSDIACPFCYLGKRKLEKAIKNLKAEDKVEVEWKSFQLDPSFPKDTSYSSIQYLSEKKGYPIAQIEAMCDQLEYQGKSYGIEYNFDSAKTVNTYDMHRLLQWSKKMNKSNELKEAFIHAYFSEGIDLSKHENILAIIVKSGLNYEDAKVILSSNQFSDEVTNNITEAKRFGIRGVPFFLINGDKGISGAQDDSVFEKVISTAIIDSNIDTSNLNGQVCTPDGLCD